MSDRMRFRVNLLALSVAGLALAATEGRPYVDAFGRAYEPAPRGQKRPGPRRRDGSYSGTNALNRKAMRRRGYVIPSEPPLRGVVGARIGARRARRETTISPSLASWRETHGNAALGIGGAS